MAFEVRITQKRAGDRNGEVYELTDDASTVRAEVWPHWGFNCLKWQLRGDDGHWDDILYHAPDWESNPVPTRSGHPILFPFPGRLRDGRLTFAGRTYQLPLLDSTKKHGIHGFTPRHKWRVTDWNGDDIFAFVTGEFTLTKDLSEAVAQWPADFVLSVTYRLYRDKLRIDARVENPTAEPLPFGLGYHPYFRVPGMNHPDIGGCILHANMCEFWESEQNLPTGWRRPLTPDIDFRTPRAIGSTQLDHVLTGACGTALQNSELIQVAFLSHPHAKGTLQILADSSFRELVLFTPPHRHAVALEPYTCSADAANLKERGMDSGWRVLAPHGEWESVVEYRWQSHVV